MLCLFSMQCLHHYSFYCLLHPACWFIMDRSFRTFFFFLKPRCQIAKLFFQLFTVLYGLKVMIQTRHPALQSCMYVLHWGTALGGGKKWVCWTWKRRCLESTLYGNKIWHLGRWVPTAPTTLILKCIFRKAPRKPPKTWSWEYPRLC